VPAVALVGRPALFAPLVDWLAGWLVGRLFVSFLAFPGF